KLGADIAGYRSKPRIGTWAREGGARSGARDSKEDLNVVAVRRGNRDVEARLHPLVKASYLGSPPLVVAFALAGTVHKDLTKDPVGQTPDGKPVMLSDLWPSQEEVNATIQ